MRVITIDCAGIQDKAGFHRTVSQALAFPHWYGNNLDALHDCLTEISSDTRIQFVNWHLPEDALGPCAAALRRAMTHAAQENPHIQIEFE